MNDTTCSVLSLAWRTVKEQSFQDFLIDGSSLAERLHPDSYGENWFGVLGWCTDGADRPARAALLGTPDSDAEWEWPRIGLYHLCFCTDPLCGMLTAERIEEDGGKTILWANFCYEPLYRTPTGEDYLPIPPIRFAVKQYAAALQTGS
jgi:hypothetical protein